MEPLEANHGEVWLHSLIIKVFDDAFWIPSNIHVFFTCIWTLLWNFYKFFSLIKSFKSVMSTKVYFKYL